MPSVLMSHPLKLTASLVEYDVESKSFTMECKVFRDDFQRSLNRTALRERDPSTLTKEDKIRIIESHFKKYYTITHNGKTLPLKLASSKLIRGQNVLVMRFEPNSVVLKKGDTISIKNALFFDDFGYAQTNRVVVRIPPFSIDDHHVATFANHQISYALRDLTK